MRSSCPGARCSWPISSGSWRQPAQRFMRVRDRRGLALLVVAFGPYAMFHLLFQDTPTRALRPAHPSGCGVSRGTCHERCRTGGSCAGCASDSGRAGCRRAGGISYGRSAHPAFSAISDMTRRAALAAPAAVYRASCPRPAASGAGCVVTSRRGASQPLRVARPRRLLARWRALDRLVSRRSASDRSGADRSAEPA